ncbi:DoxX family membrane protein [Candidatus Uhrbacteria bacterium]|nr:DoxX family membrane protein [Candidatus Uhrbacteria bacterium]
MAHHERLVSFLLRVGLAVAFLYAAVSSFLDPSSWIGFFPSAVRQIFAGQILLVIYSLYEIVLAIWLLTGKYARNAAWCALATLILIILSNITLLDILFRDLTIFTAAGALLALHWHQK